MLKDFISGFIGAVIMVVVVLLISLGITVAMEYNQTLGLSLFVIFAGVMGGGAYTWGKNF